MGLQGESAEEAAAGNPAVTRACSHCRSLSLNRPLGPAHASLEHSSQIFLVLSAPTLHLNHTVQAMIISCKSHSPCPHPSSSRQIGSAPPLFQTVVADMPVDLCSTCYKPGAPFSTLGQVTIFSLVTIPVRLTWLSIPRLHLRNQGPEKLSFA